MKTSMMILLVLSASAAAQPGPELEAEIRAYHAAQGRAMHQAAVAAIRQDLLDELESRRWTQPLDLALREVRQAPEKLAVGAIPAQQDVRVAGRAGRERDSLSALAVRDPPAADRSYR